MLWFGKKLSPNDMFKKGIFLLAFSFCSAVLMAQQGPQTEEDYYAIKTLSIPDDIKLEVGGIAILPDARIAVSTRRGDIWMIENAY